MGRELFVDTSAWYPIVDRGHPDHERVASVLRERIDTSWTVVTTNLVLAEAQALVMRRMGRGVSLRFLSGARAAPNVVVYSDEPLEEEAERDWLARYSDQDFSLTDAVSFSVMARRRITEALALDRHFEIAGFHRFPGD